ncbi:MAG TPA: efflux transporter periplasmic adaptor subunit, partial [Caulobacteraceae bacterium]|nr:efflux transporter periplasmic adaptor subunit [Caulobacteraceae bacterium]
MDRRIERKPWRRYAPWAAGVALLVVAGVTFFLASPSAGAKAVDKEQVQVAEVRRAPFHDFVPAR